MILGNSNKGNTGKKYLMRKDIQNITPTADQLQKADEFNLWFVANRESLIQEWTNKQLYDEDVFTDTYIRMCEGFIFGDADVKCYRSYFSRSYFTNCLKEAIYENRFSDAEINNLNIIDDTSDILENQQKDSELVADVIEFVKCNFSPFEYHLFLENLDGNTYPEIADTFGVKLHHVSFPLIAIKKAIRTNPDFTSRRLAQSYKSTLRNKLNK